VSEFIGFITSEASDRLLEEKRKTITGEDLIEAMRALGFEQYLAFLQNYLKKYRNSMKGTRTAQNTASDEYLTSQSAENTNESNSSNSLDSPSFNISISTSQSNTDTNTTSAASKPTSNSGVKRARAEKIKSEGKSSTSKKKK
jgi:hypothetical protein